MTDTTHIRFAVLASDVAVCTLRDGELLMRFIQVNRPPHFVHMNGLPGGLLDPKEDAEQAAKRHVESRAGIAASKLFMEQLYTFSAIDRDPRGRVVAVTYLALVPWEKLSAAEQKDTPEAFWAPATKKQKLAYDHNAVVSMAIARLRARITSATLIAKIMPKEFTLTDLETAYKNILGTELDKRNFRKKILKLNILTPIANKHSSGTFRPAQLYRFASKEVKNIEIL